MGRAEDLQLGAVFILISLASFFWILYFGTSLPAEQLWLVIPAFFVFLVFGSVGAERIIDALTGSSPREREALRDRSGSPFDAGEISQYTAGRTKRFFDLSQEVREYMERTGRLYEEVESESPGPVEPSRGIGGRKLALAFSLAGSILILYHTGLLGGRLPAVVEFVLLYVGFILIALAIAYLTLRFALKIVLRPC